MKLIKIKRRKLIPDELKPYIHPNPLVRWMFWLKFKCILKMMDNGNNKKVLDFGSGYSVFLPSLSIYFKKVYAMDKKLEPLNHIVSKFNLKNVKVIESDGKLPFEDNYFDYVIASDVLEHFKEPLEILKEFKRVLKDNGKLIMSIPTENLIYSISRVLFYWNKKPMDHYINYKKIIENVKKVFKIEKEMTIPFSLPIFKIISAVKKNEATQ